MTDPAPATFRDLPYARPDLDSLARRYAEELAPAFRDAKSADAENRIIETWNGLRSNLGTSEAIARVRYKQDTKDAAAEAENAFFDAAAPRMEELEVLFARTILGSPRRSEIAERWGPQLIRILEARREQFRSEIAEAVAEEAQLGSRYTKLLAQAEIPFRGESLTLSELARPTQDPDRATREEAQRARFGYFEAHREELDEIYDRLVRLRDGMGRTLGFGGFTRLGYLRMTRTDYGPAEVARFREEIRRRVVPLAREIRNRQAKKLGLAKLLFHDEPLHDPRGNPKPVGDGAFILGEARRMYHAMHPDLGRFIDLMIERDLLDLESRKGKSHGGFCSFFPDYRVPFIFSNFNGTQHDVEVLTHEAGHAFQGYMSRDARVVDYFFPTLEACEIHSMSMEFLAWPFMERFFGEAADRFRRQHLAGAILFLPYAALVDEFQHEVYARPGLAPRERKALWLDLERRYLPWRDYGGLPFVSDGGLWQHQRHIYASPFYYIDYALAETCALQMWRKAESDRPRALEDYFEICRVGGSLPFQEIVRRGRLVSPFEEGCLAEAVEAARAWLAERE